MGEADGWSNKYGFPNPPLFPLNPLKRAQHRENDFEAKVTLAVMQCLFLSLFFFFSFCSPAPPEAGIFMEIYRIFEPRDLV